MPEICGGDEDFCYHGEPTELYKFYKRPDVQETRADYFDSLRKSGAHAVRVPGGNTKGHLTGPCENNQNGVCVRAPNCFAAFVKQNPPQLPQESQEEAEARRIRNLLRDSLGADNEETTQQT